MTYSNLPNGLTSFGVPLIGGVNGIPLGGQWLFVNNTIGSDGNEGTLDSPLKTITRALAIISQNTGGLGGNNSVIAFWGTMPLTSTLVWNLPQVHLVGMASPLDRGKRARFSASGTVFSPMVSVTAAGCWFANFGTFYGFDDASAQILWSDTGGRNCYDNIEFMGFGHATAAAHVGSRAFKLATNVGETTWRNCRFGVDTIARTAANATLEITTGAPRLKMENTTFESYLTGSGANAVHLLIGSGGIDRMFEIKDTLFYAATGSGGSSAMTQAMSVHASAGGHVVAKDCWFDGVTNVETTASANVFMTNQTVKTSDAGLTVVNAPA